MAKILVVEDHEQIRPMLMLFLRGKGHEVDEAPNGQEGLAKIGAGSYDLIITDLEMPIMDGATMLIEANYPKAILASGKFAWLETDAARVAEFPILGSLIGRCAFVAKPFNWTTFEEAVDGALAA